MCVFVQVHVSTGALTVRKRPLALLELELQAIENHLSWVLGTELRSFARAICAVSLPSPLLKTFLKVWCLPSKRIHFEVRRAL